MSYSREVRLGLVLYGGVSLAVYENGVAQELYRAVRGEGIYGLLKDLTDSDIVVDIVSGTSAGGVNGIMLAYALACKKDFSLVAKLWRDQADIEKLLSVDPTDETHSSILNSTYYRDQLAESFRDINAHPCKPSKTKSDIEELDLFVTGTDVDGDISTYYDDGGHPVDVKNHRTLFKLAYRGGGRSTERKNDFAEANSEDLAKLCRLTSCFPVAFKPVEVASEHGHVDHIFHRWGQRPGAAVYLDGGILNNKPFTSTIDQIYRRTATRDVERFLIYVDPDPEFFAKLHGNTPPDLPNIAQAARKALLSIPRYQSISADLEAIERHNERAERISQLIEALDVAEKPNDCALQNASVYAEKLNQDAASKVYRECRLIQLRDAAVFGILNTAAGRGHFNKPEEHRSGRILVQSFSSWPGEGAETLQRFDVYFRQRRAYHLSRILMRMIKAEKTSPDECKTAWETVNHFFKLYEILGWAMVQTLNRKCFPWKCLSADHPDLDVLKKQVREKELQGIAIRFWGEVKNTLEKTLSIQDIAVPSEPLPERRSEFHKTLSGREVQGSNTSDNNLLLETDRLFTEALQNLSSSEVKHHLYFEFSRFLEVDRQLFPVQFGAEFESPNAVRVVRFSATDGALNSQNQESDLKVYGRALGAFGGFFSKNWRANDIMVGRMNAVCELIKCIMTPARLSAVKKRKPMSFTAAKVQEYFDDGRLLPEEAETIANSLNSYLRESTPPQGEWETTANTVVSICQNLIRRQEAPNVTQPIESKIPGLVLAKAGLVGAIRGFNSVNAALGAKRPNQRRPLGLWAAGLGVTALLAYQWKRSLKPTPALHRGGTRR